MGVGQHIPNAGSIPHLAVVVVGSGYDVWPYELRCVVKTVGHSSTQSALGCNGVQRHVNLKWIFSIPLTSTDYSCHFWLSAYELLVNWKVYFQSNRSAGKTKQKQKKGYVRVKWIVRYWMCHWEAKKKLFWKDFPTEKNLKLEQACYSTGPRVENISNRLCKRHISVWIGWFLSEAAELMCSLICEFRHFVEQGVKQQENAQIF